MTFNYDRLKATADRLIAAAGQAATLTHPGAKTGTPHNPTIGTPTPEAVTVVVEDYRNFEVDGARIQATDKKVLLARSDLVAAPTTADTLTIGGDVHAIVSVKPLSPGGTALYYEVQARR